MVTTEAWCSGECFMHLVKTILTSFSACRACQRNVPLYLSETEPSPYSFVVQLQHFVTYLALKEHPPPNITWNLDMTSVSIQGKGSLSLATYRLGLKRAVEDAQDFLLNTLMRGHSLSLEIPENFLDDLPCAQVGYGWVDTLALPHLPDSEPLLACFLREPNTPFLLPTSDGHFQLRTPAVHEWLYNYHKMTEMFLCLTLTTLPAPPRGTELVDSKVLNTTTRMRNLFRDHGRLWLIGMYDKTTNNKGHDGFIPRLYPKNVDRLISIWLVFARPVAIRFMTQLKSEESASVYREFLFPLYGARATSDQLTQALKVFSSK